MKDTIELIAQRKLTNGARLLRQHINKGLNKAIAKAYKMKDTSVVVWKGISLLDNETPIMVTLSGFAKDSDNSKTGAMCQVAILPIHTKPSDNYRQGSPSVCGDCKYNGGNGCYVSWHNLTSHWNSTKGQTPIDMSLSQELVKGLEVRLGSAGDPAAVPVWVWQELLRYAHSFTGYTHQWSTTHGQQYKDICMASVDSTEERQQAIDKGWNTFLVYDDVEPDVGIRCLASSDKTDKDGLPYQCITCMACNGKGKKHINEKLHGATNTIYAARKARA